MIDDDDDDDKMKRDDLNSDDGLKLTQVVYVLL